MKRAFLFLCCILLVGCTTTNTYSYKDVGHTTQYQSFVVGFKIQNLQKQILVENKIAEQLNKDGVKTLTVHSLMPPTGNTNKAEFEKKLNENNVDAIIFVEAQGEKSNTYTDRSRDPMGYDTSTDYSQVVRQFNVKLIDTKTQKTVWVANITANTLNFTLLTLVSDNFDGVANNIANEIASKLKADKLLKAN